MRIMKSPERPIIDQRVKGIKAKGAVETCQRDQINIWIN